MSESNPPKGLLGERLVHETFAQQACVCVLRQTKGELSQHLSCAVVVDVQSSCCGLD